MNLNELKKKLQPKLHKFEIEGVEVFIHRPSGRDMPNCINIPSTLILCVKDENGDPVFSDKDEEGRINVDSIDFTFQTKIYQAITALLELDKTDELEKK